MGVPKPIKLKHDHASAIALCNTVTGMMGEQWKLFCRTEPLFQPIGMFTTKKVKFHHQTGRLRTYLCGLTFDWRRIEELGDWLTPDGHLRPCVVLDNDFMIVTARKNPDGGDDPRSFHWVTVNPRVGDKVKDTIDRNTGKMLTVQYQKKMLKEAQDTETFYNKKIELMQEEKDKLLAKRMSLSSRHSDLKSSNAFLYGLLQNVRIGHVRSESQLNQELKSAVERGRLRGMTDRELFEDTRKQLPPVGVSGVSEISKKFEEVKKGLTELEEREVLRKHREEMKKTAEEAEKERQKSKAKKEGEE